MASQPASASTASSTHAPAASPPHHGRRAFVFLVVLAAMAAAGWFYRDTLKRMFTTISTDDAYVHSHVTFVAARVPGQVLRVLVDDNNAVRRGDVLVELDPTPYQITLEQRKAAVAVAEADLLQARAQVRAIEAGARGHFFDLQNSLQKAQSEIEALRADVANLAQIQATLAVADTEYQRVERINRENPGAASQKELDLRRGAFLQATAAARSAEQTIRQRRAAMGLPLDPPEGQPRDFVPNGWDQNYPPVRTALAAWGLDRAQLGLPLMSFKDTPEIVMQRYLKEEASGDIDRLALELLENAPAVRVAAAHLEKARRDLAQAELDLRYTQIVSEIDGVVARRNVNPGNFASVGQSLLAVRSSHEIWINANFKETQLSRIRIGQPVDIYVDAYGSDRVFKGRVTGFSAGTGATLSILPPENATGNFVKVVQRLPVRIDLLEPPPPDAPLFVGLSVDPYVRYQDPPTGPNAGMMLQPSLKLPTSRPDAIAPSSP